MILCWRSPPTAPDFDSETFVPIYDDFISPAFWAELLSSRCDVCRCSDLRLPVKTSRLRVSAQSHWGYNFPDYEILLKNMIGEKV